MLYESMKNGLPFHTLFKVVILYLAPSLRGLSSYLETRNHKRFKPRLE